MIEKTRRDPWLDRQQKDEEDEAWAEEKLPHCEDCGCPIYDFGYEIDGQWYCESCMRDHYKEIRING